MHTGQRCVLVVTDLFVKPVVLLGRDVFFGTRRREQTSRPSLQKKLARTLDCQRPIQRLLIDKNDSELMI